MQHFSLIIAFSLFNCQIEIAKLSEKAAVPVEDAHEIKITGGSTIKERYNPPAGFERVKLADNSFGQYLRNLPLKPDGEMVKFYNGTPKFKQGVYDAVVDMEISNKDLQQCADAIMRLRGEYLYQQQQFDNIHFNLTNGFRVDYSEWMKGKRVAVKGNQTNWVQASVPSNTYKDFRAYMEFVFMYAGTLSLSKELKEVPLKEMQVGDVFIIGGSPGHAVIVVDMCESPASGEKYFMLAQSYMPAQETQVLVNNNNTKISPWYSLKEGEELRTPEWNFKSSHLKRFQN